MIDYINTIINERWTLIQKIGECSQGGIFIARDSQVPEGQPDSYVAVKISLRYLPRSIHPTSLVNEIEIYNKYLFPNGPNHPSTIGGIPQLIWSCPSLELKGKQHAVLVMTLLGYSLDYMRFYHCGGKISLKSILMVGLKLIDRIQSFHELGLVHCGIKPENFVIDPEDPISLPKEK